MPFAVSLSSCFDTLRNIGERGGGRNSVNHWVWVYCLDIDP